MREVLRHLMERAQSFLVEEGGKTAAEARPYLEELLEQLEEDEPGAEEAELFARCWLGRLDAREERWEEAAVHLERATELDPGEPASWAELAEVRSRTGEYEAAVDAMREAVALEPNEAVYVFALGNLYLGALEQPRRALPFLARAAAKRPDEPATLLSLGRCFAHLGRPDEARARLERALELSASGSSVESAAEATLRELADVEGVASSVTPTAAPEDVQAAQKEGKEEEPTPILNKAGVLVESFLSALGATKDQAIGAVLSAVIGDQIEELHARHSKLAETTPGMEPLQQPEFLELLGERVRLAFNEGMETAGPEDLARAKELDELLKVDDLGIEPAQLLADDDDDDDEKLFSDDEDL